MEIVSCVGIRMYICMYVGVGVPSQDGSCVSCTATVMEDAGKSSDASSPCMEVSNCVLICSQMDTLN